MSEFLQALLQFPTILFTGLLGLSVLYWLLVIVGAADLNPFDGAEGAVKGAVEGAVKGATEGAVKGAAEALKGASGVDVPEPSFLTEALAWLGLTKVPITLSFSLFSLFAWMIAFATRYGLDSVLPSWASAIAATGAAIVGGTILTSAAVRPFARIFADEETPGSRSLIGKTVRVMTDVVDDKRGQAELKGGGHDHVLTVRSSANSGLKYGDEAVIVDVDLATETYTIEPLRTLDDAFKDLETERGAAAQGQPQQVPIEASDRKQT